MKLLRTNVRVNPRDSLGQGLDAAITFVLFFVAGFFLDRWLGTTPWMMVLFAVAAGVGLFYKLRTSYDARMDQHDAERAERAALRDAGRDTGRDAGRGTSRDASRERGESTGATAP